MHRTAVIAAALILVATTGCTGTAPPQVVISYSTTPMPAEFVVPTPSPTPTRTRRPARAPSPSPSRAVSSTGTAVVPPDLATSGTTSRSNETSVESPAAGAKDRTAQSTPTLGPSYTATSVPGQVPEDQGVFVTSSSRGSRYYYARDDGGWHRIQPENRVWFLTAEALLRAFPDRILHDGTTATPIRSPLPTGTVAPS